MTSELYLVSTVLVVAGLALVGTGIAHRRGWLRRNFVVGIRSPATLSNDAAWKRAHDASFSAVLLGGGLLAGSGLAAFVLRPAGETAATVLLLAPTLTAAAILVTAGVRAHLLARPPREHR